jgi:nitrite reductase/ring-hydroxylating ferredoxin subunit
MAAEARLIDICAADALAERGHGVRFDVRVAGRTVPAFVVRFDGVPRGYLNRCAHVAMELDWQPGEFFDFDREFLVCSTHGALYEPATGTCAGGACTGRGGLRALTMVERDGRVAWEPDGYAEAPAAKEG